MMTTITITTPVQKKMTAKEARQATRYARRCLREAWLTLLDVYDRDGWRPLGYSSWREYACIEFEVSKTHAYRLLEAAEVVRDFSEGKHIPDDAPRHERHLRELARLPTADLRRAVWEEARADGDPTAAALEELVSGHIRVMDHETERHDSADDDHAPRPSSAARISTIPPDYRARAAANLADLLPIVRKAGAIGRAALPHVQTALKILNCEE